MEVSETSETGHRVRAWVWVPGFIETRVVVAQARARDGDDDDASDGDANVRATRDYMLYACMRALQRGGESRARRGRFWRGAARARGRRRRRRRRLVRRDRATTMTVARWCFS